MSDYAAMDENHNNNNVNINYEFVAKKCHKWRMANVKRFQQHLFHFKAFQLTN